MVGERGDRQPPYDRGPRAELTALRVDPGCCHRLNWGCDVLGRPEVECIEAHLDRAGFASRCDHPALRIFRHREGHEVAWVLPTGRVQLRVDIDVPRARRRGIAKDLHRILSEAVHRTAPSSTGGMA